jgi:putative hemolysin
MTRGLLCASSACAAPLAAISTGWLLDHAWQFVAMVALLACSAFFSGTETAMFNLTRGQLHRLQRSGRPGAAVALLMRRPRGLLQTLLLGNMVVNVAYEAIAAVTIISLQRGGVNAILAAILAAGPLLVLILAGEVTPKMLAYRVSERWATAAALPISAIATAAKPIVWVLEHVFVVPLAALVAPRSGAPADITSGELSAILDLSARRGLIGYDANAMLQEILQLTDIRVADIMVPRVDVIAYDVNAPPEGLAKLMAETHLRKIPVHEGDIDEVVGVVHANRLLLNPGRPLRELMADVLFLPEAANIERALLQLRTRGAQTAIAVDEYGGVAGLVTLEDIVEEIVGNIEEPAEAPARPPVRQVGADEYLLDGDLAVHEWVEAFKIDLAEKRISTVGGFVTSLLGHIPQTGEQARWRNLLFTVEATRGMRVAEVRLKLLEDAP